MGDVGEEMPRYNYECLECGATMELTHSMTEDAKDCPECTADNSLKKILTIPNVQALPEEQVGSVVKSAIEEYKQRIKKEKGVWGEFDLSSVIGKK